MKTIIYIKFPSSKKDYAYLLDEGADKVPSPGDTLVFCRGASRYGAMTTNIQVTCLKQVMFIPTVVTAKLCISKGTAYSSALVNQKDCLAEKDSVITNQQPPTNTLQTTPPDVGIQIKGMICGIWNSIEFRCMNQKYHKEV